MLRVALTITAGAVAGAAFFGTAAYLILVFGPDLDASALGF